MTQSSPERGGYARAGEEIRVQLLEYWALVQIEAEMAEFYRNRGAVMRERKRLKDKRRAYVKELIKKATPAERRLKLLLDAEGLSYQFQAPFLSKKALKLFIADFKLEIPRGFLVVELDGSFHHGRERYDKRRSRWLKAVHQATVIRFTNQQVFEEPRAVMTAILNWQPRRIRDALVPVITTPVCRDRQHFGVLARPQSLVPRLVQKQA